jgi:tetratricopeptide (TPR) repeat protein
MKNILIILFLCTVSVKAQKIQQLDSLMGLGKYYDVIAKYDNVEETLTDSKKAQIYDALSISYFYVLKYNDAKKYTIKSYELYDRLHDSENVNRKLITLGAIYTAVSDYKNAKYYLDKAMATCHNKMNYFYIYNSYIYYYHNLKDYDNTKLYIDKCLELKPHDPNIYLELGKLYTENNQNDKARATYRQILTYDINQSVKNECYINLAKISDDTDAITYLDSVSSDMLEYVIEKCVVLQNIYKKLGNLDSVFYYSNAIIALKDSLTLRNIDEASDKLSAEFDSKYHVQQAEHLVELKTEHNKVLNVVIIICVIIIVLSVGGFFWVKRQKEIKEKLSNQLSHKNREIMDSINYARGIQQSILPTDMGPGVSLLFNPKDVVSGDFYWHAKKGDKRYYVVADCTGHGVPGALMSMLCSQLLDQAIAVCVSPKEIVDWTEAKLNEMMLDMNRSDSMEFGVICVEDRTVSYYGLKRPLYISTNSGISVFKPKDTEYTSELSVGDTVYVTTDGFVDQFGTVNKKYGSARFKAFLETLRDFGVDAKRDALQLEIETWMGREEQTDDILVMGVQIY